MTNPDPIKKIAESPFMKEFREFINRGNIMDLASGFTAIVKSLVDDMIMPIASLLAGGLDFSTLSLDIPNVFGANTVAHIAYGNFLQNVVNFLIIAFTIFIIVRLINRMNRKHDKDVADAKNEAKAEATKKNSKG